MERSYAFVSILSKDCKLVNATICIHSGAKRWESGTNERQCRRRIHRSFRSLDMLCRLKFSEETLVCECGMYGSGLTNEGI